MNGGKFWMVYCDGGHGPVQKHNSESDAYIEAKRISDKTGRTSFVLESIGGFEIPKPGAVRFALRGF